MLKRYLQGITFYLLLPGLYVLACLPFSWLYKLADGLFFILYYIIRYRRTVVWNNLMQAFPEKGESARQAISRAFYQQLCDLLVEHLKSLTMTPEQAIQRGKWQHAELFEQLYAQGQSILLVAGHFGNWEWWANSFALKTPYPLYAVYKPLHHPDVDQLLCRLRQRFDRAIIPTQALWRTLYRYDATPKAIGLLTDQAPAPTSRVYHTVFLNQPTRVAQGVAQIALRFHFVVVYVRTTQLQRGYYRFQPLVLDSTSLDAISEAHTRKLEEDIRRQPALWLWSHRRWKPDASSATYTPCRGNADKT